jgi:flavin reductase (DIM6/NTAB) family NADH-FMN oxidoreductase RutF
MTVRRVTSASYRDDRDAAKSEPMAFRALMAAFPTGVAVITTTASDGRPRGMTCSSVCSVTLSPPTLLICLRQSSPTLAAIQWRSTFTVNLLHDGAQRTAALFASGAPERFDLVRWHMGAGYGGPHLSDDSHAFADCRVSHVEQVGDHTVVFGEALRLLRRSGRRPLLYGLRGYRSWPGEIS